MILIVPVITPVPGSATATKGPSSGGVESTGIVVVTSALAGAAHITVLASTAAESEIFLNIAPTPFGSATLVNESLTGRQGMAVKERSLGGTLPRKSPGGRW